MSSKLLLKDYDYIKDFPFIVERRIHESTEVVTPHEHDFCELVIVQEGHGYHILDNSEIPITAGNIFIVNPHNTHSYAKFNHLTLLNIMFSPEILRKNEWDLRDLPGFQMLFRLHPKMNPEKKKKGALYIDGIVLAKAVVICDKILNEINKKRVGCKAAMISYFIELLILLSRRCKSALDKSYDHTFQISKIIGFLENNYVKKITLQELANISNMSKSTMRRRFTEVTGISPIDYLLKLRLEKSVTLLISTRMSITDIAFSAGFEDSNYFARQFHKFTGFTPSKLRKQGDNLRSMVNEESKNITGENKNLNNLFRRSFKKVIE